MLMSKLTQKIEHLVTTHPLLFSVFSKCYISIIKSELKLAHVTSEDHILFIGGGPCPCSAILMHQLSGAKITVIDQNIDCIQLANRLIHHLGIPEDRFRILHHQGETIDASPYSLIHMALQIYPKDKVLEQIKNTKSPESRVLVRQPKEKMRHFYDQHEAFCPKYKTIQHRNVTNISETALYQF